ncbi:MAG: MTH938/NDUFAF3 family protein, partial [Anaerolineae bacterium]|nr:MTH938/NDUFAF3 family protein [Anaerolineae bacterium]
MTLTPATWRLISTPPASGAWNMAVDEALLESVGRRASLPVLRLYAWDPPCLSLGYAQPLADVDQDALLGRGWELVRRLTGGRAILHADELTYSVIAPPDEPRLAGDILESYRRLSTAILAALEMLSLPVKSTPSENVPAGQITDPVCFEVPSHYEITVKGKKLVGSAQARRKEGILQHGTLPLGGDLGRITQALAFPDEEARQNAAGRLLERAATVESSLGRPVSWEEAARAFESAFSDLLNIEFQSESLTPEEEIRAGEFVQEKYGSPEWISKKDNMMKPSPKIEHLSWGKLIIAGKTYRDAKLYPGGAREWDWSETGTHHQPGILPADVQELLDNGAEVVILSKGIDELLGTAPETIEMLNGHNIPFHILQTEQAVELYNQL